MSSLKHLPVSLGDHGSTVNVESLICGKKLDSTFLAHCLHHLPQPHITSNASYNEGLLEATTCHGSLCDLHQQTLFPARRNIHLQEYTHLWPTSVGLYLNP